MSLKQILFFGILTIGLFLTSIYLEKKNLIPWKNYNYKFIQDFSSLDSKITKSNQDHGFLLLNDSIMVWGGHKLLSSTNNNLTKKLRNRMIAVYGERSTDKEIDFIMVPLPFRIVKISGDTVFYVIQNGDTLTFDLHRPEN